MTTLKKGTCQICGKHLFLERRHVRFLSSHQSANGGTCPGSLALPCQDSVELLHQLIISKQAAIFDLERELETLRTRFRKYKK